MEPLKQQQNNKTMPALLKALLFIITLAPLSFCSAETNEGSVYKRPSSQHVRAEVQEILSNPELKPTKTFLQWLGEKFSNWEGPDFDISPAWGSLLMSFLVIWCILTLAAILLHFLWSLWVITGTSKKARLTDNSAYNPMQAKSYEELYELAKQLAHNGNFAESICIMMLALLRKLDTCGILRLHESKTNSDYLREFPTGKQGRKEFKNFVFMFEQAIYSGKKIDTPVYNQMKSLLEQIDANVCEKA